MVNEPGKENAPYRARSAKHVEVSHPGEGEPYRDTLLRIQKLNPAQKILLAQRVGLVERKILARDLSAEVLMALVSSPNVTEPEIERIVGAAATPEAVLESVYASARWGKSARVRHACLKNSRLPAAICRQIIAGCSNQQLASLAKDPVMPRFTQDTARQALSRKGMTKTS